MIKHPIYLWYLYKMITQSIIGNLACLIHLLTLTTEICNKFHAGCFSLLRAQRDLSHHLISAILHITVKGGFLWIWICGFRILFLFKKDLIRMYCIPSITSLFRKRYLNVLFCHRKTIKYKLCLKTEPGLYSFLKII